MIKASTADNVGFLRYSRSERSAYVLATVLIVQLGFTAYAQADSTQTDTRQWSDYPLMSILDGKSFSGELAGPGIDSGSTDVVVFKDGMFVSEECQKRCGYTDGPYWIRSNGEGGVQFKAETPCLDADASIVWNGIVRGDEIEGTFTWTSERWYWTVEKEFSFKGKLIESEVSVKE